jgi:hypothetical protein
MASNLLEGKVFVKISELDPTVGFAAEDEFVLVQNGVTLKTTGLDITDSVISIGNLANKPYVDSAITALIDGAPGILDTLDELATALNDDANFAGTITTIVNTKLASGDFGLRFWEELAQVNTYHIAEGINLYWTQERFDTALAAKNTFHIAEGSNLYFTEQRVHDVLDSIPPRGVSYNDLIDKPTNPTYNSVIVSGPITNPNHATTKAYVDWKVSSIPTLSWNSIANISNNLGPTRIALGRNAGGVTDAGGYGGYGAYGGSSFAIAIGNSSGRTNQGGAAVSIGVATGYIDQGENAVAVGFTAGSEYQGTAAVAVGESAGQTSQGSNAVAIGRNAGRTIQGNYSVAVGTAAGSNAQGDYAVAIGTAAGVTNQPAGSIVINASGNELNGSVAGLYIDPIRSAEPTYYIAYYDPETKEVTYGPAPSGAGGFADRLINGSKQVILQSNGYIRLVNGAQLYDYGSGTGNGYGITDAVNSTYIGYDPSDTLGALHMDSYTGGNIRIRTTTLPNTYKDWLFSADGKLTLPAEPTSADHAATKGYVDSQTSAIESFSGSYNDLTDKPTAPTYTSVTTTNLNVQNVTLTGAGPCTFTSGNDLNFVAAGAITFNGSEAITKTQLKSIVAASTNFADFQARIAAL